MSMVLDIGGVERSLASLLRAIDFESYTVDLMLVETQGVLQRFLPEQVRVLSFSKKYNWVFIPKGEVFRSFRNALGLSPKYLPHIVMPILVGLLPSFVYDILHRMKINGAGYSI